MSVNTPLKSEGLNLRPQLHLIVASGSGPCVEPLFRWLRQTLLRDHHLSELAGRAGSPCQSEKIRRYLLGIVSQLSASEDIRQKCCELNFQYKETATYRVCS